MNTPEHTIRRWTIVGVVFAILYSVIAVVSLAGDNGLLGWIVLVVAILYWIGTALAATRQYSAARVVLIIGGIVALPLGIVMIIAGNKIAKAGKELEEPAQPVQISPPAGQ